MNSYNELNMGEKKTTLQNNQHIQAKMIIKKLNYFHFKIYFLLG